VSAIFTHSIARDIREALQKNSKEPMSVIKEDSISGVSFKESNYATGPLTKTLYFEATNGVRYKISIEDLKEVKGHGHITYAEANKLGWFGDGVHWDKDEGIYKENDAEYISWLAEEKAKMIRNDDVSGQLSFNF
jgi:hypothetical protein